MKPRPNYGLIAVLVAALVLRAIYWSKGLLGGDSIHYAIGGLGTWCAHSPGFFGYCFAGWLVNQLVANINDSLILINVITSLLGIYFCHCLAVSFGMNSRNALLATAAYAFSVNLDYFSVIALSYAPEGMFATLFALLCRRAMADQSAVHTFCATVVWAASGAFRQTSIAFLAPLWLYMLWKSGPVKRLPLHLFVALPIIFGWSQANRHYLAACSGDLKADVGRGFWLLQVMMPTDHDQTKLGLDEDVKEKSAGSYHWPFMEVIQWVDEKTGTKILPDYRSFNAPPPSPARAFKLAALQLGKLGFYLIFSLPCLLMLMALLPATGKIRSVFEKGEIGFFVAWIFPVGCFFIVGHMGSFGYLQIFLSGLAILTVLLLSRAFEGATAQRVPMRWMKWQIVHACLTVLALSYFLLVKPFQSSIAREKLMDVLALQYTGHAIQNHYAVARSNTNKPGPPTNDAWLWCETDADILKWYASTTEGKDSIYKPHVVR